MVMFDRGRVVVIQQNAGSAGKCGVIILFNNPRKRVSRRNKKVFLEPDFRPDRCTMSSNRRRWATERKAKMVGLRLLYHLAGALFGLCTTSDEARGLAFVAACEKFVKLRIHS